MLYRKLVIVLLILFGFNSFTFAKEGNRLKDKQLSILIHEALKKNPEIRAASARLQASKHRIPQAGAWEDPRVSIDFVNIPIDDLSLKRTPMSGIQYGLKQKIPFPGKKRVAKKKAKLESNIKSIEAEEIIARTIWQIRHYYYQYYYVSRSIGILKKNQKISNELLRLSQKKLAIHRAPAQDVLKAQIDYGQIAKKILDLKKQKKSLQARLNSLIGRPANTFIATPKMPRISFSSKERGRVLAAIKNQYRPLENKRKMIEIAKMNQKLAKLSYFPDIDLGLSYRQRQFMENDPIRGEDFFSVSASIPIPIFAATKQRRKVKEAYALQLESEANLHAMENQLEFQAYDILAELEASGDKKRLITNALLPQAQAAFQNSKAAYESGSVEFINVLSNQLSVLHFEMEKIAADTSYAQAVAKLDYLAAKNLDYYPGALSISPQRQVLANVAVTTVKFKQLNKTLRVASTVAFDKSLYLAQQEYLSALNLSKNKVSRLSGKSSFQTIKKQGDTLVQSAREKLLLMGISKEELLNIEKTKKIDRSLYFPEKNGSVWINAQIYELDAEDIKRGQKIEIVFDAYPGEVFRGQIKSIVPVVNDLTRTITARIRIKAPQKTLSAGMFAHAKIIVDAGKHLAIPTASVINTGDRKVVWVKIAKNQFVRRDVTLGRRMDDSYIVLEGLKEGEKIVSQGGFLIDSEAELKLDNSQDSPACPEGEEWHTGMSMCMPKVGK